MSEVESQNEQISNMENISNYIYFNILGGMT